MNQLESKCRVSSIHIHTELEVLCQHRDVREQYRHLKRSTGLGGRQARGQQLITDESGVLIWSKDAVLKRWRRFFDTLPPLQVSQP